MPLAAFGGLSELMHQVAPSGPVYQAGTFAAHPLAVAAGLATLDVIDRTPGLYDTLEARGAGCSRDSSRRPPRRACRCRCSASASMWTVFFSATPIASWDDAAAVDREAFAAFFRAMLARGVLLPPSAFESAFVSVAHDDAVIDQTIAAAAAAFAEVRA